jgi:hypothetical protein
MKYPEHEKLKVIAHLSQSNFDFIEWLGAEKGYRLCRAHEHTEDCEPDPSRFGYTCGLSEGEYYSILPSIRDLLAEFHGIDLKKIESEKEAMLEELRKDT